MKIAVLSYSYTGNNARLAAQVADKLSAKHLNIKTKKTVTYGAIMRDLIFAGKPEIDFSFTALDGYDLILFVAPVWMGQVAFPLRRCLDAVKHNPCAYAFLSISGGADGGNPKLAAELTQRTGKKPAFVLDLHIRALLPVSPAPTRDDTSKYQLTQQDCEALAGQAIHEINRCFPDAI